MALKIMNMIDITLVALAEPMAAMEERLQTTAAAALAARVAITAAEVAARVAMITALIAVKRQPSMAAVEVAEDTG